jgi:two-component system response regulator HydG
MLDLVKIVNHREAALEQLGIEHNRNGQHVLVIEEDEATRSACIEIATRLGFSAEGLPRAQSAQQLILSHAADLLLMELKASQREGLQLLEEVKALKPKIPIIVMTCSRTIGAVVEAMRGGATDYLPKPFLTEELEAVLEHAAQQLATPSQNLMGRSREMDKLNRILAKVAQSHHPALIVGESGAGRETVARTIHAQSERASQPFETVDCSALAPELVEHELFGYVKGAFPGALRNVPGVLASAERGTVFLDEIGQLTLDLQRKLLRVLQEREIRPTGATHRIPLNARILAASRVYLAAAVTKGIFRQDLYNRLNVVTLQIPSLRERRSDIPLLATHFLKRISRESGQTYTLSDDALRGMMSYDWPENVRELECALERACIMTSGTVIHICDLPMQLQNHVLGLRRKASLRAQRTLGVMQLAAMPRIAPLAELEKRAILNAIQQVKGDKLLAARLLGISKTTLYRKLKKDGLSEDVCRS